MYAFGDYNLYRIDINASTYQITVTDTGQRLPSGTYPRANAIAAGPDGNLYGIARMPYGGNSGGAIFKINVSNASSPVLSLIYQSAISVYGGFAMSGWDIYFGNGTDIYQYSI